LLPPVDDLKFSLHFISKLNERRNRLVIPEQAENLL